MTMVKRFNPPHPGLTLRDDVLPALSLTVTEATEQKMKKARTRIRPAPLAAA